MSELDVLRELRRQQQARVGNTVRDLSTARGLASPDKYRAAKTLSQGDDAAALTQIVDNQGGQDLGAQVDDVAAASSLEKAPNSVNWLDASTLNLVVAQDDVASMSDMETWAIDLDQEDLASRQAPRRSSEPDSFGEGLVSGFSKTIALDIPALVVGFQAFVEAGPLRRMEAEAAMRAKLRNFTGDKTAAMQQAQALVKEYIADPITGPAGTGAVSSQLLSSHRTKLLEYALATPDRRRRMDQDLFTETEEGRAVYMDLVKAAILFQHHSAQQGVDFDVTRLFDDSYDKSAFSAWLGSTVGSAVPYLIAMLGVGAATGGTGLLVAGGAMGIGDASTEAISQDPNALLDRETANRVVAAGAVYGLVERVTGVPALALRRALSSALPGELGRAASTLARARRGASYTLQSAVEEGFNELAQEMLVRWAAGTLDLDNENQIRELINAFAAGVVGGAGPGAASATWREWRIKRAEARAAAGQSDASAIEQAGNIAANLKMRDVDPEKSLEYFQALGLGDRYLAVDAAGLTMAASDRDLEALGLDPDYVKEAADQGIPVSINFARYLNEVPGRNDTLTGFIVGNASVSKPGHSRASAEAANTTEGRRARRQEEAQLAELEGRLDAKRDLIVEEMTERLVAAGQNRTNAKANAEVTAAFYRTMGALFGEEALDNLPLPLVQGPAGQRLERPQGVAEVVSDLYGTTPAGKPDPATLDLPEAASTTFAEAARQAAPPPDRPANRDQFNVPLGVPDTELSQAARPGQRTRMRLATALDRVQRMVRGGRWSKGRDLKLELDALAQERNDAEGIDWNSFTDENARRLADALYADAELALTHNPNAIGWYKENIGEAKEVILHLYPELATDEEAEFAFTYALAVTSNGLKVDKNFELAATVYEHWRDNKHFPNNAGIGTAAQQINSALAIYDKLVEHFGGWQALRDFMIREDTVKNIETELADIDVGRLNKKGEPIVGIKISGEGTAAIVRGAAILGPKIGNGFFSNLYGMFDGLTMDRWLIRTVGRIRGTLVSPNEAAAAQVRQDLRDLLNSHGNNALGYISGFFVDEDIVLNPGMTDGELDELAQVVAKKSTDKDWREHFNGAADGAGDLLRKRALALAKHLDGQVEAPRGAREREFIRKAFRIALERLQQHEGFGELTMADLQAVLWYSEKLIYESAKKPEGSEVLSYADEEAPNYANAARKLVRDRLGQDRGGAAVRPGAGSAGRAAGAGRDSAQEEGDGGEAGEPPTTDLAQLSRLPDDQREGLGSAVARLVQPEDGAPNQPVTEEDLRKLDDPDADPEELQDFFSRPGWGVVTASLSLPDTEFYRNQRENLPDIYAMSVERQESSNAHQNELLEKKLIDLEIPYRMVEGMYKGESDGTSFLILADEATVMEFGRTYMQESVLTSSGLVYTRGPRPDVALTGQVHTGDAAISQDFYSRMSNGLAVSLGLAFDTTGPGFPNIPPGYTELPSRPQLPVREDGKAELHHWSDKPLKKVDPAYAGTGPLRGAERARGAKLSYFAINPRANKRQAGTGYVREAGLGTVHHVALVDPMELYPYNEDPDGLRQGDDVGAYEAAIQAAGYRGYYVTDDGGDLESLGNVAALFSSTPVRELPPEEGERMLRGDVRGIELFQGTVAMGERASQAGFPDSVIQEKVYAKLPQPYEQVDLDEVVFHREPFDGSQAFFLNVSRIRRATLPNGATKMSAKDRQQLTNTNYDAVHTGTGGVMVLHPEQVVRAVDFDDQVHLNASPQFWSWFGSSQVKHRDGQPMLVYHSTSADVDFEAFRGMSHFGTVKAAADRANFFRRRQKTGAYPVENERVIPAYLSIQNPIDIGREEGWTSDKDTFFQILRVLQESGNTQTANDLEDVLNDHMADFRDHIPELTEQAADVLMAAGYDGIKYINIVEDKGSTSWVAFQPSQIKSPFNEGTFDPADTRMLGQQNRGSITLPVGASLQQASVIKLLEAQDASTFMHEAGHMFLQMFTELASRPGAPRAALDDLQTINEWLGKTDTGDYTVAQQEQWAEAFEQYLYEGVAPSPRLKEIFRKFSLWLTNLYRSIINVSPDRVEHDPTIREVMDRMLATEAELMAAQSELNADALFNEQPPGISAEAWKAYVKLSERSEAEAHGRLLAKAMRKIKARRKKEWNDAFNAARQEAMEELSGDDLFNLIDSLGAHGGIKLNRQELIDTYGESILEELSAARRGTQGDLFAEDGMPLDALADTFSFPTADDLVTTIIAAPRKEDKAVEMATAEADAAVGDPADDVDIREEAEAALQNPPAQERIAREGEMLRSAAGKRGGASRWQRLNREAKRKATEIVDNELRVGDVLEPGKYLRAAEKAAREAQEALAKVVRLADGTPRPGASAALDAAAAAKEKQLLSSHVYRIALERKQKFERAKKRLQRMSRNATARKNIGPDFVDAIDALLDQYEFRDVPVSERADRLALDRLIKQHIMDQNRGAELAIPSQVRDYTGAVNWKDVTPSHLEAVIDAVDNLAHIGRSTQKQLKEDRKITINEMVAEIVDNILDNRKTRDIERSSARRGSTTSVLREAMLHTLTADTMLWEIDGSKDALGAAYRYIKKDIDEAVGRADVRKEQAAQFMHQLFRKYLGTPKQVGKLNRETKLYAGLGSHKLSKLDLIAMALNSGNAGNWARLTDNPTPTNGRYDPEAVQRVLLEELTDNDWRFVQEVWDYLEGFWPEIRDQERLLTGLTPKGVEADLQIAGAPDFVKGGYYPIQYDGMISPLAGNIIDTALATEGMVGIHGKAQTARGHAEARQINTEHALDLNLGVPLRHVYQVIHDLELRAPLRDSSQIVNHQEFQKAMIAVGRQEDVTALRWWLQDIAIGERSEAYGMERWFRWMRGGFVLNAIGFNMKTALLQVTGLVQSMQAVGAATMVDGLSVYLRDPGGANRTALARSSIMAERQRTFNRDINQMTQQMQGPAGLESGYTRFINGMMPLAFATMQKVQYWAVDVPTWLSVYRKELKAGRNADDAAAAADRELRAAQGSGLLSDRGALERGRIGSRPPGEIARLFTVLGSYMFAKFNLAYRSYRRTDFLKPVDILRFISDMAMLFVFEALVSITLQGYFFEDEDERDELWKVLMHKSVATAAGTLPVMRDIVAGAEGFGYGGSYQAYNDAVGDAWKGIMHGAEVAFGAEDAEFGLRDVKSLMSVGGTFLALPSATATRVLDALFTNDFDVEEDWRLNLIQAFTGVPMGGDND